MIEDKADSIRLHNREAILQVADKDYRQTYLFDEYVKELRYDGSMDEIYLHKLTQGVTYRNDKGLVIKGDQEGPIFESDELKQFVMQQ